MKTATRTKGRTRVTRAGAPDALPIAERVRAVLASLERHGSPQYRDGMERFAIHAPKIFGVPTDTIRQLAKRLGKDHELAVALWDTEWYEARVLTALVGEPERVTAAEMDRWARDFDNWGICDALCFHLFDRTPHAWRKVEQWSGRRGEFVKRAAFALLASIAVHDKRAPDEPFVRSLRLIEREAGDERNFVKKAVSWALRSIGKRNPALNAVAIQTAERLTRSPVVAARWVGRDAHKELTSAAVQRRLVAKQRKISAE